MLAAAGVPSPAHDARALALHVLGLHRPSELVRVEEFPGEAYAELAGARARRVPLQHLVGTVAFRWIELEVGPGVFIPRPETELVAGAVVEALAAPRIAREIRTDGPPPPELRGKFDGGDAPVVVDLCSGSGAIALSVAHEVAGAVVHGVELDAVALEWARRNDSKGAVTWHEGPAEGCLPELDGRVDVVVSNPPYVPVGTAVDQETQEHDPALALWGGVDGLDVIREVERAARRLLKPGGLVVVEHDVTHGVAAPAVFHDWDEVADHQDLTGRDRFVTARWRA